MSDITNDGKNLDENGLDMDSKFYEVRKRMLDDEGTTYEMDSAGILVKTESNQGVIANSFLMDINGTVIIGLGIVCITAIIITWIIKRK